MVLVGEISSFDIGKLQSSTSESVVRRNWSSSSSFSLVQPNQLSLAFASMTESDEAVSEEFEE